MSSEYNCKLIRVDFKFITFKKKCVKAYLNHGNRCTWIVYILLLFHSLNYHFHFVLLSSSSPPHPLVWRKTNCVNIKILTIKIKKNSFVVITILKIHIKNNILCNFQNLNLNNTLEKKNKFQLLHISLSPTHLIHVDR